MHAASLATTAIAVWLACGIGAAGFFNADLRGKFPTLNAPKHRSEDLRFSLFLGLLGGPITLLVSMIVTRLGKHGWTLNGQPQNENGTQQ